MKMNLALFWIVYLEYSEIEAYYKLNNKEILISENDYTKYNISSIEIIKINGKNGVKAICEYANKENKTMASLEDLLNLVNFKNPFIIEPCILSDKYQNIDINAVLHKNLQPLYIDLTDDKFVIGCDIISIKKL